MCPGAMSCIPRSAKPPPSGGDIDYCFYRRPASRDRFQKICRRRPTRRWKFKRACSPRRFRMPPNREPPRSGGGSDYMTYRIPASGFAFRRYADGLFSKRKLSHTYAAAEAITRCIEIPRAGSNSVYFLPPEANALLWLQSTVFPQTPVSPTHP
ncbi:hypothetical protein C8R43DRAFT_1205448 [Mycena crocata]|nr:hypothetical protein C8R43DRAFT_1205448 [Mycena crocata]